MDDPTDQFPIFVIGERPLIFSLDTLILLREKYHICGTLTGVLPSFPQQNVFQGLPLELMPEDVQLLVNDLKVAYLVDDFQAYSHALDNLMEVQVNQIKDIQNRRSTVDVEQMWINKKRTLELHDQPVDDSVKAKYIESLSSKKSVDITTETENIPGYQENCLRCSVEIKENTKIHQVIDRQLHHGKSDEHQSAIQNDSHSVRSQDLCCQSVVAPSHACYAVYKYLQQKNYYLSPGLRFGGQFLAYPGDPLRFHSHYIVNGFDWNEEFDLLDMIGGGRLGTTVKKNWVAGATDPNDNMHFYSIEWARFG